MAEPKIVFTTSVSHAIRMAYLSWSSSFELKGRCRETNVAFLRYAHACEREHRSPVDTAKFI